MNDTFKINEHLDIISSEINKYFKNKTLSITRIMQIISLRIGYYCNENNIAFKNSKEILSKIFEYISLYDNVESKNCPNLQDIRKKLLNITNSRSDEEIFFFDTLIPNAKILYKNEKKETDCTLTKTIFGLNNDIYYTKQKDKTLIYVKELKW